MSPIQATATSPLDGLDIHHDSTVAVNYVMDGEDEQELYDVLLDGDAVGSALLRDDADSYAADISKAIAAEKERVARAQLVHGVRQLADFIEQHPALPAPSVFGHLSESYGRDALDRLAAVAEQLGEYTVSDGYSPDRLRLRRTFDGGVDISVTIAKDKICTPAIEDGKVVWQLPELPGTIVEASS